MNKFINKNNREYTPVRKLYAWIGFIFTWSVMLALIILLVVIIWKGTNFMAYELPDIITNYICS